MLLIAVAAMSKNRVIGRHNKIPWHLPTDLKRFKDITKDGVVLMGRNTYESIGHPLADRVNIVVTKASLKSFPIEAGTTCLFFGNLEMALQAAAQFNKPIYIIGGESIYKQLLPRCNKIHLTTVLVELDGDAFFPELNMDEWDIVSGLHGIDTSIDKPPYKYEVLTRRTYLMSNVGRVEVSNKLAIPTDEDTHIKSFKELASDIGALLEEKNKAYGNAFAEAGEFLKRLYPTGIKVEQYGDMLCIVRIYDKLKRIATAKGALGENPYNDIAGYALLGVYKDQIEKK